MTYRKRYVNRREMLEQAASSRRLVELALQRAQAERATPARNANVFLAYHADCWRRDCKLARSDAQLDADRRSSIAAASAYLESTRL